MDPLTITIGIPPDELWPNTQGGRRWQSSHGAKKAAQLEGKIEGHKLIGRLIARGVEIPLMRCRLTARGFFGDGRRLRDADNLLASLKGLVDGLQMSGLIADDKHVEYVAATFVGDPERVEITLSSAEWGEDGSKD